MRLFRAVGELTFLLALGIPAALHAQSEPSLSVQGSAQVQVESDMATVRLGIVGQAPTAEAAQQQVNETADEILRAVRSVGIGERDIQTARLSLTPIYSRQRTAEDIPEIVAYRATNTIAIEIVDLSIVGEVIDAGLNAGANQLEGVSFGLRDDLPAREAALQAAVREARSKATVMAEALDVRLDGIVSVEEGGVFVQLPQIERAGIATLQADFSTPVSPGEVTVSASVSVRYRLAED